MTLIVEDGTARSDAESYASTDEADAYLAARGMTTWAGLQTVEKENALRRATDYMEQTYRLRWRGYRVNMTQSLDWPRFEVPMVDVGRYGRGKFSQAPFYSYKAVPQVVKNACIELAFRAASGQLLIDRDIKEAMSESVGPLSVTYSRNGNTSKSYSAVERMLTPFLLASSGGGLRLMRG